MKKPILLLAIALSSCKPSSNLNSRVSGHSPLAAFKASNMKSVKYFGSQDIKGVEICYFNSSEQSFSPSELTMQVVYENEILIGQTKVELKKIDVLNSSINFDNDKFTLKGTYANSTNAPDKTLNIETFKIKDPSIVNQIKTSEKDSKFDSNTVGRFFRWTSKNQNEDMVVMRSWQFYKGDDSFPFLIDVSSRKESDSGGYLFKTYYNLKRQGESNKAFYQIPESGNSPEAKFTSGPKGSHNIKPTLVNFDSPDEDSTKFDHICYP